MSETQSESKIQELRSWLISAVQDELAARIRLNEPLKMRNTMRVGGAADLFAEPEGLLEVIMLCDAARACGLPYFVLGNRSNLVVSDEGIEGLVIHIGEALSQIRFEEDSDEEGAVLVTAYAGAMLSRVAMMCAKESLAGMEFSAGIPGSIGGAVFMNAGAYGREMKDVVYRSVSLTASQTMKTYCNDEHQFGYRTSCYMQNDNIILSVTLRLFKGDATDIFARMKEYAEKRSHSQPLSMPSAGSAFKRPYGHYTGALIEAAGLKGFCVGGAQVSEKHAGFIVNTGSATARDVYELGEEVQRRVFRDSGVLLEPEIRFIGRGYETGGIQ